MNDFKKVQKAITCTSDLFSKIRKIVFDKASTSVKRKMVEDDPPGQSADELVEFKTYRSVFFFANIFVHNSLLP